MLIIRRERALDERVSAHLQVLEALLAGLDLGAPRLLVWGAAELLEVLRGVSCLPMLVIVKT